MLVERLRREERSLSGGDRELARAICLEIAERADALLLIHKEDISRCSGLMDRVQLYEDDTIAIRAHLFHVEASETFVHNHGQAMISTCLEGSYIHQIYEVDSAQGGDRHHYRFLRLPNGVYSEQGDCVPGELEEILCQPFQAGQSLFISALAKHKMVGTKQRVTTITIRDAVKRFLHCDILCDSAAVIEPTDAVAPITDDAECQQVRERLRRAALAFRSTCRLEFRPPGSSRRSLHKRARLGEAGDEVRSGTRSKSRAVELPHEAEDTPVLSCQSTIATVLFGTGRT